jgi:hypothetical protein
MTSPNTPPTKKKNTKTMHNIDDLAPREVQIQELNFSTIGSSAHIGLYGSPEMGKTRMAKRLARFFVESRNVTCVYLVVSNADTVSEWISGVVAPMLHVFNSEKPEDFVRLDALNDHELRGSLVIFDDVNEDFMQSETMHKFAVNAGTFTTIWCMQNCMLPITHTLHTHVGVFHTWSSMLIAYIYREYASKTNMNLDAPRFERLLGMLTRLPNQLMWIDKSRKTIEFFDNNATNAEHDLVRTENIKYDQHVKRVKTTSNVPLDQDDRFCFCWQCRIGKWIDAHGHVVVAATAAAALALAVKMAL